jgi:hypothetical protein
VAKPIRLKLSLESAEVLTELARVTGQGPAQLLRDILGKLGASRSTDLGPTPNYPLHFVAEDGEST